MHKKIFALKNFFIIFFLLLSLILLSLNGEKANFVINLNNNLISCFFNLNLKLSQSFIDMIYYNNQAEIVYDISLLKKSTGSFFAQSQKLSQKKIVYYLNYKPDVKSFSIYNEKEFYESFFIDDIINNINTMSFANLFDLKNSGQYYCIANVSITSLNTIFPPMLFLLLFYNPYNIKISNLESNVINYEIK